MVLGTLDHQESKFVLVRRIKRAFDRFKDGGFFLAAIGFGKEFGVWNLDGIFKWYKVWSLTSL